MPAGTHPAQSFLDAFLTFFGFASPAAGLASGCVR